MALYRDDGVVLRVQKLGEADRIVTVLTRRTGRVRAVAKGVRRTRSKFGSRLEPFSHVSLQLAEGRSLDVVTEAVALDAFGGPLAEDYARYTTGTAMLEAAERLTAEEREPSLRLYLLLVSALRALVDGGRPPTLLLDSFLLRALSEAGYGLALGVCARCGESGPHRAFSIPAGGSVCATCRPAGAANPAPSVLALLAALTGGDWDSATTSADGDRRAASGLVAAGLQWHLERGLRSLPFVERGLPRDRVVERGSPRDRVAERGLPRDRVVERGLPRDRVVERGLPRDRVVERGLPRDRVVERGSPRDRVVGSG